MFGLSAEDWSIVEREAIAPLQRRGCALYVFGSRARGDHQPFSDLDLLVDAAGDISDVLSEIRDTLEESELPIKVDVVLRSELAESYRPFVDAEMVAVESR